jgi:hypothetical protein
MGFLGTTIGGPSKYNLTEEDAPQTVSEAAAVLNERPGGDTPRSRFDVDAYRRAEARRIFAADALEILSVGLGQISAGEAVNLGPTLRAQAERHQQMRAALRGAPTGGGAGAAGGSYSDLLIPGNEDALRQFLIENQGEHLLPMVDMGPEYKRLALQGVADYITTAPERTRAARRNQQVIEHYARTRGPEAAEALANDPQALEFATEQYYDEVFGEQGGGAAGAWTPQMSEDLAAQFEELGMPQAARAVRNGGEAAYKTYLGELAKVSQNNEEARTLANMSEEERAQWGENNGLDPETSANLAPDVASLRTAVQRVAAQREEQEQLTSRREQLYPQAAELVGRLPPNHPFRTTFNRVYSGTPTLEDVALLEEQMLENEVDLFGRLAPDKVLERAREMGLDVNSPLVRGTLAGRPQDIETFEGMYADFQQGAIEDTEPVTQYSEEELRNAAAELGAPWEDDLYLALNGEDEATRRRAANRIMENYEAMSGTSAEKLGEGLGQSRIELANRNLAVQQLEQTGNYTPEELAVGRAQGPEAAIAARETRRQREEEQAEAARINSMANVIGSQVAEAQQDPQLAEIFRNVETQQELATALRSVDDIGNLSEEVRTALAAMDDPEIATALAELRAAGSDKETVQEKFNQTNLEAVTEANNKIDEELTQRRSLRAGMAQIIDLVTSPGYNPEAGGPLAPFQTYVADIGRQVFGEGFAEAIQSEDENIAYRLVLANQGEFFGDFRAEGSGQLTEKEGEFFRAAMASGTDRAVKQALLAQRILRMDTLAQRELELRREWLNQQVSEGNFDAINTQEGMMDYVIGGLEEMQLETFPGVDLTADNYEEQLRADIASGNVDEKTVIRVYDGNKTSYMFAKDLATP